jgi:peptide/nickel transport system permease protein
VSTPIGPVVFEPESEHEKTAVAGADRPPRALVARRILLRVVGAIVVLWATATMIFFLQQLLPGNPADVILNQLQANPQPIAHTAAERAPINREFGFGKPVLEQYVDYIGRLARGNFGSSYLQHEPVLTIIRRQVGPTVVLTVTALILAWLIALTVTLFTGKRGRARSTLGSGWEIVTASTPPYWLGVILLVVFAIDLKIFPVQGGTSLSGLVLPAVTLAIPLSGFLGQVTRDEFEKVLDQPFITSARARGMSDLGVRLRHALRHAVLPAITLSGWALGALFSGAVLVETAFARPGLGNVMVTAAQSRDVPLVSGIVILIAAIYVIANILVDLAYTVVDPRLRGGAA